MRKLAVGVGVAVVVMLSASKTFSSHLQITNCTPVDVEVQFFAKDDDPRKDAPIYTFDRLEANIGSSFDLSAGETIQIIVIDKGTGRRYGPFRYTARDYGPDFVIRGQRGNVYGRVTEGGSCR